jgi:long-chain acyl-CoA synthetase
MERIWLKSYPRGVPADIDPNQYRSLIELFDTSIRQYADRPAYHSMGKTISFGELEKLSREFGAWLQAKGLAKGARVALMMPNCLQFPIAMFGALRAGCTVVNVNPLYTARELEHQLKDSGAEVIVILENFASVLQQVKPRTPLKHVIVTSLGEMLGVKGLIVNLVVRKVKKMVPPYELPGALSFKDTLREGNGKKLTTPPLGHEDIAYLQYTGGTTGVSKGAVLTHRNVIAALLQYKAWLAPATGGERQVIITALPLYHIFSLTVNSLNMMVIGGENVLITNPRDIPGFVKELGKHKFTIITGVNTLFNALLNHPDFAKLDFSSMKLAVGGGMAVQKAVAERWKQVTGVTLIEGYGLTETAPSATANPLDLKEYSGSIGVPMPSTEIVLRDDAGRDVPPGQPGEICIRGPQVMAGYWQRPEETAQVIGKDGFLHSGDVGIMDEKGFIRIVDR